MADGTLMSLKPWHQANLTWGGDTHGKEGSMFLELSLYAKGAVLSPPQQRQWKGDLMGQSWRIWDMSEVTGAF